MFSKFILFAIITDVTAQKGTTGDMSSLGKTALGLDKWLYGVGSAADPTSDDYVYALNFISGEDYNSGTDRNALKSVQVSTINTEGVKSDGAVLPGSGSNSASLDLSGDPVNCIRSVEIFDNTYTTGGWSSSTYYWVSGFTTTDSTGAVSEFGSLVISAGSINFGSEGCLVGLEPVQDRNGDVQGIVLWSKEVTTLYTIPEVVEEVVVTADPVELPTDEPKPEKGGGDDGGDSGGESSGLAFELPE